MSKYTDLDKLYRKYLLNKAQRNGENKIYCPFTDTWLPEESIHVCHYIPRAFIAVRYNEDNAILGSAYSNVTENGIIEENGKSLHINKFEKLLGNEKINTLLSLKLNKISNFALNKLRDEFDRRTD